MAESKCFESKVLKYFHMKKEGKDTMKVNFVAKNCGYTARMETVYMYIYYV